MQDHVQQALDAIFRAPAMARDNEPGSILLNLLVGDDTFDQTCSSTITSVS
jgi:hypothetical protein